MEHAGTKYSYDVYNSLVSETVLSLVDICKNLNYKIAILLIQKKKRTELTQLVFSSAKLQCRRRSVILTDILLTCDYKFFAIREIRELCELVKGKNSDRS